MPMNICILGLWHLGTVTAACVAALGHRVVGLDFDELRVAALNRGTTPVFAPGLADLLRQGLGSGRLRFSCTASDPAAARAGVSYFAVGMPRKPP
jgi:UDPglucose 6-dehydrogenase